jgi:hypothetical protein
MSEHPKQRTLIDSKSDSSTRDLMNSYAAVGETSGDDIIKRRACKSRHAPNAAISTEIIASIHIH